MKEVNEALYVFVGALVAIAILMLAVYGGITVVHQLILTTCK